MIVLLIGCSPLPRVSVPKDIEIEAAEAMAKEKCEQVRPGSNPIYREVEGNTATYACDVAPEQIQGGNDLLIDVIRTTIVLF